MAVASAAPDSWLSCSRRRAAGSARRTRRPSGRAAARVERQVGGRRAAVGRPGVGARGARRGARVLRAHVRAVAEVLALAPPHGVEARGGGAPLPPRRRQVGVQRRLGGGRVVDVAVDERVGSRRSAIGTAPSRGRRRAHCRPRMARRRSGGHSGGQRVQALVGVAVRVVAARTSAARREPSCSMSGRSRPGRPGRLTAAASSGRGPARSSDGSRARPGDLAPQASPQPVEAPDERRQPGETRPRADHAQRREAVERPLGDSAVSWDWKAVAMSTYSST